MEVSKYETVILSKKEKLFKNKKFLYFIITKKNFYNNKLFNYTKDYFWKFLIMLKIFEIG